MTTGDSSALVSIVIPCYNHGHLVGETIESALKQRYAPVEVVVVDDGSTDNSSEVAGAYPVRLLRQTNQGVAAAMNAGVRASSGAFALTLGADDLLDPEYVGRMVAALGNDVAASFAYSRIMFFGAVHREYPTESFSVEALAERNYIAAVALFKRCAYEEAGGFDCTIPRCEDWDFWLTLAERGHHGVWVPEPLVYGRQHRRSYNSRDFLSVRGLRREWLTATMLRDKHPSIFARRALVRRLRSLPGRLARGQVTPRFAALLLGFYGAMLLAPSPQGRA